MNTKVIVSLTSHTKERLKNLPYFLYYSILQYNYNYVKIVLTLTEEDIKNISPELQMLIDTNKVELLKAEKDLKSMLKFFYAMKKYRDLPVITIDDDCIYPKQMIPDLLELHEKYPDVILARSAYLVEKNKLHSNWLSIAMGLTITWFANAYVNQIRTDIGPEGYGGVLYPPNILELSDENIPEMTDFLSIRVDDIYLTLLGQRKHLKYMVPFYKYNKLDMTTKGIDAISLQPDIDKISDILVQKYFK